MVSGVERAYRSYMFRPGNIGHHSGTGTLNPNDFQSQIIKACARMECAPLVPDWRFEITPVDFLGTAITKFSDEPAHLGKVYNVVGQDPVTADAVFAHMKNHGNVTDRVSLDDWKLRLHELAACENNPEWGVLVHSLESVEGYLSDTSASDISRFSEAISEIGLTMPTVDVDYMTMFLRE